MVACFYKPPQMVVYLIELGEGFMKYVCELCGKVYDDAVGDVSRGIPAGTDFLSLTAYECPDCGSGKEAFVQALSGASAGQSGTASYESQR